MRKFILAAVAVLAFAGPAQAQTKPSFDCAATKEWADLIVCNDSELIRLDLELAAMNADLYGRIPPQDAAGQRLHHAQWSNGRGSCRTVSAAEGVSPKECLMSSYVRRIAEIRGKLAIVNPPRTEAPARAPVAAAPAVVPREDVKFLQNPEERVDAKASSIQPGQPREKILVRETTAPALDMPSSAMAECRSHGGSDVAGCLSQAVQQSDIDMQMQVSRMEVRLRSMDMDRPGANGEIRFNDTQKAFEAYREAQCRWRAAVAGAESDLAYKSCRVDMNRARAREVANILAAVPQG